MLPNMKPPHRSKFLRLLSLIAATCLPGSAVAESPAASAESVQTRIDWPKYFKRLDPVSETLPLNYDAGTFAGNDMRKSKRA
jgi:hypothetical protein